MDVRGKEQAGRRGRKKITKRVRVRENEGDKSLKRNDMCKLLCPSPRPAGQLYINQLAHIMRYQRWVLSIPALCAYKGGRRKRSRFFFVRTFRKKDRKRDKLTIASRM